MELFFRKSGTGEPLIILHGLYGSSDNWYSIGRSLSEDYTVYLPDQRNHGNSPHDPVHTYDAMAGDLFEFMQKHTSGPAIIIGHSMGGKTALQFGLKHPELVAKMIIVDISPLGYDLNNASDAGNQHIQIIDALSRINPEALKSREEADKILLPEIPSAMVRQFLLKSLKRMPDGKFRLAINIKALSENLPGIFSGVISEDNTDPRQIPEFPLLFIKGELSPYICLRDEQAIRHFFPWARIVTIEGSGHWVHAEQPARFLEVVNDFIKN
ncbi:MAG TPA: alpha/beta fold hydrolase [Bacteroidales bacterium]|nr:alpha/beta fold hydrolase [Bacteroidales bacterium]